MDIKPEDKKYLEGQYANFYSGDCWALNFRRGKKTQIEERKILEQYNIEQRIDALSKKMEDQNEIDRIVEKHIPKEEDNSLWWDGAL